MRKKFKRDVVHLLVKKYTRNNKLHFVEKNFEIEKFVFNRWVCKLLFCVEILKNEKKFFQENLNFYLGGFYSTKNILT